MTWDILSEQVINNPYRAVGIIIFGLMVVVAFLYGVYDYESRPEQIEKYNTKGNKK